MFKKVKGYYKRLLHNTENYLLNSPMLVGYKTHPAQSLKASLGGFHQLRGHCFCSPTIFLKVKKKLKNFFRMFLKELSF